MKRNLIILSLIICSVTIAKSNPRIVRDSIGLEQKNDRIYVLHKIEQGETLYTLAKRYRADMKILLASNPGIDQNNLKVGQLIRVPLQSNRINVAPIVQKEIITHEVKNGETLWKIANTYKVEESEIKRLNNLTSNTLYAKQSLLIEVPKKNKPINNSSAVSSSKEIGKSEEEKYWWAFQPIADKNTKILQIVHTVSSGETLQNIGNFYKISVPKLMELNAMENAVIRSGDKLIVGYEYFDTEKGEKILIDINKKQNTKNDKLIANKINERIRTGIPVNKKLTVTGAMIQGNSFTTTNKHLALHRTAPEGSYIKVTNPNTKKSTFVRVLGNLQNVTVDKGIDIKLSKAACEAIGITNEKFPVELEYNE